jgi:hypothetical protein
MAGSAIGNSYRLAIHQSYHQSACLYACIVGTPGSLKTPALGAVASALEAAERKLYLA